MEFVLVAYDGLDHDAPARRQGARPAHLQNAKRLRQAGNLKEAGALLNENDEMIGSVMIFDFPSEKELQECLKSDPYVTGNVWVKMDVKRFRRAKVE